MREGKVEKPAKAKPAQGKDGHREAEIDEALVESFPASDPPSYSIPHRNKGPQSDGSKDNSPLGAKGKSKR
jgi:hypothetical protein